MARTVALAQKQVDLERLRGGFIGIANRAYQQSEKEAETSLWGRLKSLKRPGHSWFNLSDRMSDVGNVLTTVGDVKGSGMGSILKVGGKMASAAAVAIQAVDKGFHMVGKFGKSLQEASTGAQGFMQAGLKAVSSIAGAVMPGLGAALEGMGNAIIQAVITLAEDTFARNQIAQASIAQTGKGNTSVARWASDWLESIGRDEAKQWASGLSGIGVTGLGHDKLNVLLKVKYGQGLSVQETTQYLHQFIVFSDKSSTAADQIKSAFAQMKAAAQGTEMPVKSMVKWIADAGVQSRLLNVDYKVLANTMGYLASREKSMSAFGVSMRESGGKILSELTGKGFTDEMHAFLGMKAGISTNVVHAMVGSMLGKEVMENMQFTAGGGIAVDEKKVTKSDMMARHFENIVKMLQETTKGMDAKTAFYVRTKMAKETFGFSEETARTLATADIKDVTKLLEKNPEMVNETKTTNQLLGELKTMAQRNEAIQRFMSRVTLSIAAIMLVIPRLLFEGFAGVFSSKHEQYADAVAKFISTQAASAKTNFVAAFDQVSDIVKAGIGPIEQAWGMLSKSADEWQQEKAYRKEQIFTKAAGGVFSSADLARGFLVGERGPEWIQFDGGGSGQVIPDHHTKAMLSGGNSGNVVVHINGIRDREHLISEVVAAIRSNYYV